MSENKAGVREKARATVIKLLGLGLGLVQGPRQGLKLRQRHARVRDRVRTTVKARVKARVKIEGKRRVPWSNSDDDCLLLCRSPSAAGRTLQLSAFSSRIASACRC